VDLAAQRLLEPMFRMGLFENPYADEESAEAAFGRPEHVEAALDLQRRSVVLLQNSGVLPLAEGSTVYVLGRIDPQVVASYGFEVVDGDVGEGERRPSAADADAVLVSLTARTHGTEAYRSADPATGMRRMDVLSGRVSPRGKMPFALAGSREAIENNRSDVPGYDDEMFGYGHGLTY
jgi:beta-glucosidase